MRNCSLRRSRKIQWQLLCEIMYTFCVLFSLLFCIGNLFYYNRTYDIRLSILLLCLNHIPQILLLIAKIVSNRIFFRFSYPYFLEEMITEFVICQTSLHNLIHKRNLFRQSLQNIGYNCMFIFEVLQKHRIVALLC